MGNKPAFRDSMNGIAVWTAEDKNGNEYLNVRVLGKTFRCFAVKEEEK